MVVLLRHFGTARGRLGAMEFGALGILPLAALVVLAAAVLSGGVVGTWVAWMLAAAAAVPLWALAAKRLADLGAGRMAANALVLIYGLHLGTAGIALAEGQALAQWLFLLPAPGATPGETAARVVWMTSGLLLPAVLCVLSVIPGQPNDNPFGPDPRARQAKAAEQEHGVLEALAGRLLAMPARCFANTGRLTLVAVPALMLAAGVLRYDPVAGGLTTVLQSSSVGGISIVEGMLRGGLVAILFAPPIILVAMIALPIAGGLCLYTVHRWRIYARAEAAAVTDEAP